MQIEFQLSNAETGNPNFEVTPPWVPIGSAGTIVPSNGNQVMLNEPGCTAGICFDTVFIDAAPRAGPNGLRTFTMQLILTSDSLEGIGGGVLGCTSTITAEQFWRVSTSVPIKGACLTPYRYEAQCTPAANKLPLSSEEFELGTSPRINENIAFTASCADPIDATLVLDQSCSMDWNLTAGETRIEALQDSRDVFVNLWSNLRGLDAARPDDRLGVVLFDDMATPLHPLDDFVDTQMDIDTNPMIPVGGATSVGNGLQLAMDTAYLGGSEVDRDKVALLFTDGLQNRNRWVKVEPSPAPGQIFVTRDVIADPFNPQPADYEPLDIPPNTRIYTLTTGTELLENGLNYAIATATNGVHVHLSPLRNTGTDPIDVQVRSAFVNALQATLKTNTWHVARVLKTTIPEGQDVITVNGPFTLVGDVPPMAGDDQVFVPSTAKGVAVVAVNSDRRWIRARGQAYNISECEINDGRYGVARASERLPEGDLCLDDDGLRVLLDARIEPKYSPSAATVMVLTDNTAVKSTTTLSDVDIVAGEPLTITTSLTAFGAPIDTFPTGALDRIVLRLLVPEEAWGEVLSERQIFPQLGGQIESSSIVGSMIQQLIESEPDALPSFWIDVPIEDRDGDGLFTATFEPPFPGSYEMAVVIDGEAEGAGRFSFHDVQTFQVRAQPVFEGSRVSVDPGETDTSFIYTIVPVAAGGWRLGPGYQGYLWLDVAGQDPILFVDQFDGSYVATVEVGAGEGEPAGDIHFIPPLVPSPAQSLVGDELENWIDNGGAPPGDLSQDTMFTFTRSGPGDTGDPGGGIDTICNCATPLMPAGAVSYILIVMAVAARRRRNPLENQA